MVAAFVVLRPGDQDVGRLDVAVDEPLRVGSVEGAGDLAQEPDDVPWCQWPCRESTLEVRAVDVAHREEEEPVDLPGLVDGEDIRVVDRGRHPQFAHEPCRKASSSAISGGRIFRATFRPRRVCSAR